MTLKANKPKYSKKGGMKMFGSGDGLTMAMTGQDPFFGGGIPERQEGLTDSTFETSDELGDMMMQRLDRPLTGQSDQEENLAALWKKCHVDHVQHPSELNTPSTLLSQWRSNLASLGLIYASKFKGQGNEDNDATTTTTLFEPVSVEFNPSSGTGHQRQQEQDSALELKWMILMHLLSLSKLELGPTSADVFILHVQIAHTHQQRGIFESIKPHANKARFIWSCLDEESVEHLSSIPMLHHLCLLRTTLAYYWASKGKLEEAHQWIHRARRVIKVNGIPNIQLDIHLFHAECFVLEREQKWDDVLVLYQKHLPSLPEESMQRIDWLLKTSELNIRLGNFEVAMEQKTVAHQLNVKLNAASAFPEAAVVAVDLAALALKHQMPLNAPLEFVENSLMYLNLIQDWKLVYKAKMLVWSVYVTQSRFHEALHLIKHFEVETLDREGPNSMRHVEVQLCKAITYFWLGKEPLSLHVLQSCLGKSRKAFSMLSIVRIRERVTYFVSTFGESRMKKLAEQKIWIKKILKEMK